jgi:hypothetical protein
VATVVCIGVYLSDVVGSYPRRRRSALPGVVDLPVLAANVQGCPRSQIAMSSGTSDALPYRCCSTEHCVWRSLADGEVKSLDHSSRQCAETRVSTICLPSPVANLLTTS